MAGVTLYDPTTGQEYTDPNSLPDETGKNGTYVHPITGAISAVPADGYVFVANGYQLQQTGATTYKIARPNENGEAVGEIGTSGFATPFRQWDPGNLPAGKKITVDPFDLKIREAALNDLIIKRRGTTRMSTFTTGPRGVEGPAKTVLG